jgi:Uma2 family endonuclease
MAVITPAGAPVHQINLETYEQIVESGALQGQRVELIDGIITDMSPQSPEHAAITATLTGYLAGGGRNLRVQLPLRTAAPDSLPEPDLAVVAEPPSRVEHPYSALLVIEVSTTSQQIDRNRKSEMYASTGVPVYWIVDTSTRSVEVRTDPGSDGYRTSVSYGAGELVLAPLPDIPALAVAELFPS